MRESLSVLNVLTVYNRFLYKLIIAQSHVAPHYHGALAKKPELGTSVGLASEIHNIAANIIAWQVLHFII